MRVLFYCQYVLGVGHFFRSLEIARSLAPNEVLLVTGGAELDVSFPPHVEHRQLPPLMMDASFSELLGGEDLSPEEIFAKRRDMLLSMMKEFAPDILLVELYPFGRRRFRVELLPVLESVRKGLFSCKVVCSLRDILVEKADPAKYEQRVLDVLNPLFHALLVHSDPSLVTLDRTFGRVHDIAIPIRYTGFVALKPEPGAGAGLRRKLGIGRDETVILASLGSGSVGSEKLEAVLRASALLRERTPHRLLAFSGPLMDEDEHASLVRLAQGQGHIRLERFTRKFLDYMDAADLSVSLGGYNTTMNLLAAKTYGLVHPLSRDREQTIRARELEKHGLLSILRERDFIPQTLAERIKDGLAASKTRPAVEFNLDGAGEAARILEKLARADRK